MNIAVWGYIRMSLGVIMFMMLYWFIHVDSCDSNDINATLIGAVIGVVCAFIIIMVITNIMVWICCFRKRNQTGTYYMATLKTLLTIDFN